MTEKVKVVIVGAGPAGSACASALAMLGIEPVVLVDKARFPRNKPCAGGLGPGTEESLKELGLWKTVVDRSNRVTAMKAVTPSEKELCVSGSATALIMPREKFDAILVRRAGDLGARLVTGEKVSSIMWKRRSPCGVVTETGRRIEAIWTVIAAGGGTGLLPRKRKHVFGRILKGVLTRYEDFEVDSNTVEMYFDRDLKPAYGWVFPEGKSTANVGLCYD
ncbi:MAG: NAD(P)/FAD-dependent oxidoreductase [Pseudomonadota bacterium]